MDKWMNMFDRTSKQPKFKMLLGNKSESYAKVIPSELAAEYASKHDEKMLFFEVSAKNGSNVTESFEQLAELIHQTKLDEKNEKSQTRKLLDGNLKLDEKIFQPCMSNILPEKNFYIV